MRGIERAVYLAQIQEAIRIQQAREAGIKALGEFMLSAVKHRLFITAVEFEDCREIARKHGLLD